MKKTVYHPCVSTAMTEREHAEHQRALQDLIDTVVIPTTIKTINLRTGQQSAVYDEAPVNRNRHGFYVQCQHCGESLGATTIGRHLHKTHLPHEGVECSYGCGRPANYYSSHGRPCCILNGNHCPGTRATRSASLIAAKARRKEAKT